MSSYHPHPRSLDDQGMYASDWRMEQEPYGASPGSTMPATICPSAIDMTHRGSQGSTYSLQSPTAVSQSSSHSWTQSPVQGTFAVHETNGYFDGTQASFADIKWTNKGNIPYKMSRSNSSGRDVYHCLIKGCESKFTRTADLSRHYTTCHNQDARKHDCPKAWCGRTGDNGFSRHDHLLEHLRTFHKDRTVPKRGRK